ncbi:formin-like protein 20 [Nilaparvata lugens]|uniref:formin-like protein 20 n=1 Tax=Nilaparvata lugens TaxID=108931 RepID=UPI00193E08AC|nr:formin-like protein 20 [Nilaparvata lugens]
MYFTLNCLAFLATLIGQAISAPSGFFGPPPPVFGTPFPGPPLAPSFVTARSSQVIARNYNALFLAPPQPVYAPAYPYPAYPPAFEPSYFF